MTATLKEPVDRAEIRLDITAEDFKSLGQSVITALEEHSGKKEGWHIADDNREGIRVNTKDGWFLLRLSVHDPVMPMNIESDKENGVREIVESIAQFFFNCRFLNTEALSEYLLGDSDND